MTEELSNSLRDLLLKRKKIILPGIGVFALVRYPASKGVEGDIISPPKFKIVFENENKNNPPVSNKFSNYAKDLLNQLYEKGVAQIKGIGIISKNNGHFDFYQDEKTANWYTEGMPPVELKRIDKKRRSIFYFLPNVLKIQHNSLLWDVIPAILIASLMIATFVNYSNGDGNKYSKARIPAVDTLVKNNAVDTLAVEPLLIDSLTTLKEDTAQATQDPPISDIDFDTTSSEIKDNITPISPKKDIVKKRCVIITGSFKTRTYKNLMIDKLKSLGYQVHLSDNDSTTRVGLEFDCTNEDLESYLNNIRNLVEQDAWYLID